MISLVKIKNSKVALLKAVRDVVHQRRESGDIDKREQRRLRVYCREIDRWIDELEAKENE